MVDPIDTDNGQPRAVVREVNGQLVLDDPDALAMIRAMGKLNCRGVYDANAERISHFVRRVDELKKKPEEVVIVILNVDDSHGGPLAEMLMPGTDWQPFRDQGQIPFARGLAGREGIQMALEAFDGEAATALRAMNTLAVVVVDHGVANVYPAVV
jgi:hypothetical protein